MPTTAEILNDLAAESGELDAIVAGLPQADWTRPTPAAGWTIAHQIAHLAWTDDRTRWAIEGTEEFQRALDEASEDPAGFVDTGARDYLDGSALLLDRWRSGRSALTAALAAVPAGVRIPWYGPPMSATSMATARLMETFAHGQDIRDTLGLSPVDTPRLRHIAFLAFRTRDFAFRLHGRTPPADEFFVDVVGAGGQRWSFGDPRSRQKISGSALDFCLLATQRRHRHDVDLVTQGHDAQEWLTVIQAFAGPPGVGREPLS